MNGTQIVVGALGTISKRLKSGLENSEIGKRMETITEMGQNIEETPGDLRRLTVIQTPVKVYKLTLV